MVLACDAAQHGGFARAYDVSPEGHAVDHTPVRSDDASGRLESGRERKVFYGEVSNRAFVTAEQTERFARSGRFHVSDRVTLTVEHALEIDEVSGVERDGHGALAFEIDVGGQLVIGCCEVGSVIPAGVD